MFLFKPLGSTLMPTSVGHACTRCKREFLIVGTMRLNQMTKGRGMPLSLEEHREICDVQLAAWVDCDP